MFFGYFQPDKENINDKFSIAMDCHLQIYKCTRVIITLSSTKKNQYTTNKFLVPCYLMYRMNISREDTPDLYYWAEITGQHTPTFNITDTKDINGHWQHDQLQLFWKLFDHTCPPAKALSQYPNSCAICSTDLVPCSSTSRTILNFYERSLLMITPVLKQHSLVISLFSISFRILCFGKITSSDNIIFYHF